MTETDAAGNYARHYYYTTGTLDGKDGEKLTGLEYKTEWYDSSGAKLNETTYDWAWVQTSTAWDLAIPWSNASRGFRFGFAVTNDYVYVTESDGGGLFTTIERVQKFDKDGNFLLEWGSPGDANGEFLLPEDVSVDSQGDVYVADGYNNRIQKFDSAGQWLATWESCWPDLFLFPRGIALSGGFVLVVDFQGHVQRCTTAGSLQASWESTPQGFRVAGDSTGYNVYVTAQTDRVQRFNFSGGDAFQWGTTGTGDGQFSGGTRGIAVDSTGYVYVGDGTNRVQKFTSAGAHQYTWTLPASGSPIYDIAVTSTSLYTLGYVTGSGYQVTQYTYNWATRLVQVDETIGNKTSRTRYDYDDYGNVKTEYLEGDTGPGVGDETTMWRVYYPNTTANILDRPARERAYAGNQTADDGGVDLRKETLYYYDGSNTSQTAPPVKGNLTRLEQKKDASNSVSSYYTYDAYGNRLTEQDPNGNTTTWTYDSLHHTYPATRTYPVAGLSESYVYDGGTANLLYQTDLNGLVTTYEYDTFKRLRKVIKPGDSGAIPSLEYRYNSWGAINQQHVKTLTKVADGEYLWQSDYFDGLGRVVQTQARGEAGRTIIAGTTVYNSRGLVEKQYVSQDMTSVLSAYYPPDDGWKYTTQLYDGLARVTARTNADGTTTSHDFSSPWQDLATEERANQKRYFYDAYGRLATVQEYGSGPYSWLATWGATPGSGDGQFAGPEGMAIDG